MRVAVTSTGSSADSQSDERFGRALYFLVYDSESGEWTAQENDQLSSAHGVGISTAQRMIELGVDVVITGRCGPKASAVLSAAKIDVYQGYSGLVADALRELEAGLLKK
jgi:predicted Fe-Mo cluster-binding NifX family protein